MWILFCPISGLASFDGGFSEIQKGVAKICHKVLWRFMTTYDNLWCFMRFGKKRQKLSPDVANCRNMPRAADCRYIFFAVPFLSSPFGFRADLRLIFSTTHKRYQNRLVSKSQVLGLSKLAILVYQQFWYPFGWFFSTQKGIKTDGFQNVKFWGLSKLAILVHRQFWYPFGCFRYFQILFGTSFSLEKFNPKTCVSAAREGPDLKHHWGEATVPPPFLGTPPFFPINHPKDNFGLQNVTWHPPKYEWGRGDFCVGSRKARYWISESAFLFEKKKKRWPGSRGWISYAGSRNLSSFKGRYWISVSGPYHR